MLFRVNLDYFFPEDLATRNINYFMDSWWQHCMHCLVGGHVPNFHALELV
jgi:hypothetical protein